MDESRLLIIGARGQLGKALAAKYPSAKAVDSDEFDITDPQAVESFDWQSVDVVINAAAYTNVDGAETKEGRIAAWKVNAQAVAYLAQAARQHNLILIHISTDYVFDGSLDNHKENEPYSPLSVYGATKAAADIIIQSLERYYLVRTSWVIGDGKNFVRTMLDLGRRGVSPSVVADQIGRPTFTDELVRGIDHLLNTKANFGTYNFSSSGELVSWAALARAIFEAAGFNLQVKEVTTAEYYQGKDFIAPRPLKSGFDLTKLLATGFKPNDWRQDLIEYVSKEISS